MYSSNNTSCRSPVNLNSVWNTTFVTRSEEIEKKTWPTITENRLKILFSFFSFFSYIYLLIKRSTNFSQDCSRSLTTLIKLGFHNDISTSTSKIISNNNGRKDAHNTSTNTEKQNKGLPSYQVLCVCLCQERTRYSKTWFKHHTSHEPNPIHPIRLMWGSAFDSIKSNWFCLERLRRSSRLVSRE